jgi:hypothetical protein
MGTPLSKRTDEDVAESESDFSKDQQSEEDSGSDSGGMPF